MNQIHQLRLRASLFPADDGRRWVSGISMTAVTASTKEQDCSTSFLASRRPPRLWRYPMKNWLFLAIAVVGEVVATSALKSSEGFSKLLPSAIVLVGYGVAFYFLSLALKSISVGIAYAVWAGLGIVLVAAIAWIFHGQKLDAWALLGMGLIISGVAVLNLLSKTSAH
jgi:small multidrug resistance pump